MFVVTVLFEIKADHLKAFLPLLAENARRSRADEPRCKRFDICQHPDRPHQVFLYELYDDQVAFETHKSAAHYKDFSDATQPMVARKTVQTFALLGAKKG